MASNLTDSEVQNTLQKRTSAFSLFRSRWSKSAATTSNTTSDVALSGSDRLQKPLSDTRLALENSPSVVMPRLSASNQDSLHALDSSLDHSCINSLNDSSSNTTVPAAAILIPPRSSSMLALSESCIPNSVITLAKNDPSSKDCIAKSPSRLAGFFQSNNALHESLNPNRPHGYASSSSTSPSELSPTKRKSAMKVGVPIVKRKSSTGNVVISRSLPASSFQHHAYNSHNDTLKTDTYESTPKSPPNLLSKSNISLSLPFGRRSISYSSHTSNPDIAHHDRIAYPTFQQKDSHHHFSLQQNKSKSSKQPSSIVLPIYNSLSRRPMSSDSRVLSFHDTEPVSVPRKSDSRRMSNPPFTEPVKETFQMVRDYDSQTGNKMINHYMVFGELGRGCHGKVKLCLDTITGEKWAIKIVEKTAKRRFQSKLSAAARAAAEGGLNPPNPHLERIKREIAILKKCAHPHVVRLREVIDDPHSDKIYLVLEYLEGGDIAWSNNAEHPKPIQSVDEARRIFRDVVCGVQYLHYQGIVHRDIKPANLLWTADHRVKISDFGVSVFVGQKRSRNAVLSRQTSAGIHGKVKDVRISTQHIRDKSRRSISFSRFQDEDNTLDHLPSGVMSDGGVYSDDAIDAVNEDDDTLEADELELAKTAGSPAFFAPELCGMRDDDFITTGFNSPNCSPILIASSKKPSEYDTSDTFKDSNSFSPHTSASTAPSSLSTSLPQGLLSYRRPPHHFSPENQSTFNEYPLPSTPLSSSCMQNAKSTLDPDLTSGIHSSNLHNGSSFTNVHSRLSQSNIDEQYASLNSGVRSELKSDTNIQLVPSLKTSFSSSLSKHAHSNTNNSITSDTFAAGKRSTNFFHEKSLHRSSPGFNEDANDPSRLHSTPLEDVGESIPGSDNSLTGLSNVKTHAGHSSNFNEPISAKNGGSTVQFDLREAIEIPSTTCSQLPANDSGDKLIPIQLPEIVSPHIEIGSDVHSRKLSLAVDQTPISTPIRNQELCNTPSTAMNNANTLTGKKVEASDTAIVSQQKLPLLGAPIDIWAMGITLFCFVFGKVPFMAETEYSLFNVIVKDPLVIPDEPHITDDLRNLFHRLLEKEPTLRATLDEVRFHPWLTEDMSAEDRKQWLHETDPAFQYAERLFASEEDVSHAVTMMDKIRNRIRKISNSFHNLAAGLNFRRRTVSMSSVVDADSPVQTNSPANSSSRKGKGHSQYDADKQPHSANEIPQPVLPLPLSPSQSKDVQLKIGKSSSFGDAASRRRSLLSSAILPSLFPTTQTFQEQSSHAVCSKSHQEQGFSYSQPSIAQPLKPTIISARCSVDSPQPIITSTITSSGIMPSTSSRQSSDLPAWVRWGDAEVASKFPQRTSTHSNSHKAWESLGSFTQSSPASPVYPIRTSLMPTEAFVAPASPLRTTFIPDTLENASPQLRQALFQFSGSPGSYDSPYSPTSNMGYDTDLGGYFNTQLNLNDYDHDNDFGIGKDDEEDNEATIEAERQRVLAWSQSFNGDVSDEDA
ncbi:hypothetical protein O5D80_003674 [Batrachochytrium dendrobatidis]|nr:hypothetical protein O5D80_003674 [Batrachochytrium dendrobatidis]